MGMLRQRAIQCGAMPKQRRVKRKEKQSERDAWVTQVARAEKHQKWTILRRPITPVLTTLIPELRYETGVTPIPCGVPV